MLLPRFENTKVTSYTTLEAFCFILEHHDLSDSDHLECVQRIVAKRAKELKTMPQKEFNLKLGDFLVGDMKGLHWPFFFFPQNDLLIDSMEIKKTIPNTFNSGLSIMFVAQEYSSPV